MLTGILIVRNAPELNVDADRGQTCGKPTRIGHFGWVAGHLDQFDPLVGPVKRIGNRLPNTFYKPGRAPWPPRIVKIAVRKSYSAFCSKSVAEAGGNALCLKCASLAHVDTLRRCRHPGVIDCLDPSCLYFAGRGS